MRGNGLQDLGRLLDENLQNFRIQLLAFDVGLRLERGGHFRVRLGERIKKPFLGCFGGGLDRQLLRGFFRQCEERFFGRQRLFEQFARQFFCRQRLFEQFARHFLRKHRLLYVRKRGLFEGGQRRLDIGRCLRHVGHRHRGADGRACRYHRRHIPHDSAQGRLRTHEDEIGGLAVDHQAFDEVLDAAQRIGDSVYVGRAGRCAAAVQNGAHIIPAARENPRRAVQLCHP